MALFIKRTTELNSQAPLYSQSHREQLLIVALGNPGLKYKNSRHNLGFLATDYWLKKNHPALSWQEKSKLESQIISLDDSLFRLRLAQPQTYVNNSGRSVAKLLNYFKIGPSQLWVIYDELKIKWGQLAIKKEGALGSHNGLDSISRSLSLDNFNRLAIGIGPKKPPQIDLSEFVLGNLDQNQQGQLESVLLAASGLIDEVISGQASPGVCQAIVDL